MKICKQCTNPVFSKGLCINHWRREYGKPIRRQSEKQKAKMVLRKELLKEDEAFYMGIWKDRLPHECEYCGQPLGKQPFNWMFDHVIEKSKNQALRHTEENIVYTCLQCHTNKTNGHLTPRMQEIINNIKNLLNNE